MKSSIGAKLIAVSAFLYSFGALAQSGNYIDITQFGASTSAADNRHAIQMALDEARVWGGAVLIPPGTFKVKGTLIIGDAVTIMGSDRASSRLLQVGEFGAYYDNNNPNNPEYLNNSKGLLYAEAPENGQLSNITIKNMTLEEDVPKGQVRFKHEFQHLISLNGVRNAVIQDLNLTGARGDAIYIGAGISGSNKNIHNNNILIKNNTINGVNSDNRNGISVVHGSAITIEGNTIVDTSRSDMPGAIDIEPDQPFHHVQDIHILNNKITGGKAGAGLISIYLGDGNKQTGGLFVVAGNKIDGTLTANAGIFVDVDPRLNRANYTFDIYNNEILNTVRGVKLLGLENLHFNHNRIETTTDDPLIGEDSHSSPASRNLNFSHNTFKEISAMRGNGFQVYNVQWMYWGNNQFSEFGRIDNSFGYIFDFAAGASDNITFVNNEFVNWWGRTHYLIQKEADHTFNEATNKYCGNTVININPANNKFRYNPALCN